MMNDILVAIPSREEMVKLFPLYAKNEMPVPYMVSGESFDIAVRCRPFGIFRQSCLCTFKMQVQACFSGRHLRSVSG